jgi:hypothetical protein
MNEFIVNGRTYRYVNMNAFEAHKLILALVKKLGPAIKTVSMDADVSALIGAFASIEGDVLEDVALPVFAKCSLSVDGSPLQNRGQIDAAFTPEDVMDLYEVAFTLIKAQVGPAFTKALTRFGAHI